jgi:hypothetical protein
MKLLNAENLIYSLQFSKDVWNMLRTNAAPSTLTNPQALAIYCIWMGVDP